MEERLAAWSKAEEIVERIVDKHGLELYKSGPPFGHVSTYSPAEQHIEHILKVADWLLDKENL